MLNSSISLLTSTIAGGRNAAVTSSNHSSLNKYGRSGAAADIKPSGKVNRSFA